MKCRRDGEKPETQADAMIKGGEVASRKEEEKRRRKKRLEFPDVNFSTSSLFPDELPFSFDPVSGVFERVLDELAALFRALRFDEPFVTPSCTLHSSEPDEATDFVFLQRLATAVRLLDQCREVAVRSHQRKRGRGGPVLRRQRDDQFESGILSRGQNVRIIVRDV